ncbi:MAG: histidine kinase [Epsilonproteobacteria bacterium]|nr:MAG: histidine kinase [Campylobacterota bacterium]
MRINEQKFIPFLIIVVPLTLVLIASFFITSFYLEKVTSYFHQAKEKAIKEHIDSRKLKSEMWVNQINLLYDYRYNKVVKNIEVELKAKVEIANENAQYIYKKYKKKKRIKEIKEQIKDNLKYIAWTKNKNYIFINNFKGNNILPAKPKNILAKYADADYRSILLEEIQMVRKNNEGFLYSKYSHNEPSEIIYVKNLGMFNWYIGSSISIKDKTQNLKDSLLTMIQSVPMDKSNFMGLYENKKPIFLSENVEKIIANGELMVIGENLTKKSTWYKDKLDGYYYYSKYYKPFDWHLVYGFDLNSMSEKELLKQNKLEEMLDEELEFIIKASLSIVIFIVILSLLLSRKINIIFNKYQEEVQNTTQELQKLNESLESRVQVQLLEHREKDKMLIQQSKMAEMGDMLSMIAHQWRQPLNQMSYVLMNIESAHEYDELTKEYLDSKVKEGNNLLEFMSITIDDFKNYFRPDNEKEFALVSNIITTSVELIKNSLEINNIEIEITSEGRDLTHIYKNEFMQVILTIIKNAKDVLVENNIENPKIKISSTCRKDKLIVEICDNGGGVDENIKEKIFEPYFSTKEKNNGTGLGLYMSQMIIEEHLDGKISVYNNEEGACFKIVI